MERLQDQPFTFLGVFGRNGDPDDIAARMEKEGIQWRNALDLGGPEDGVLWSRWAVRGYPQFYLLDADGVIRRRWFGDPGPELEPALAELIAEAREPK